MFGFENIFLFFDISFSNYRAGEHLTLKKEAMRAFEQPLGTMKLSVFIYLGLP